MNFARRKILAILLLLLFPLLVLSPAAIAEPSAAYRPLVPRALAEAIYAKSSSLVDRFAASLSTKPGCRMEITLRMLDGRNRILFAFRGVHTLPWPLSDEKFPDLQIASGGDIILDLYAERGRARNGNAAWRYEGNVAIMLDALVLRMARTVTKVAASHALEYVARQLVDFLATADPGRLAEAARRGITDMAAVSSGQGAESALRRMILFQDDQPDISTLVQYVKNGNLISFIGYQLVAIATGEGVKLATGSLGAMVGSAIAPGVGTVVGSLVARIGSLILVDFTVNKVWKEWYLKTQLQRLQRLFADGIPPDSVPREKYLRTCQAVSSKIIDQIKREQFQRFNVLLQEVREAKAERIPALRPVILDVAACLRRLVLQDRNWLPARYFYQLRQALIDRGLDVNAYGF